MRALAFHVAIVVGSVVSSTLHGAQRWLGMPRGRPRVSKERLETSDDVAATGTAGGRRPGRSTG
eukprot:1834321-Pyramimonas_sp.AAC.1